MNLHAKSRLRGGRLIDLFSDVMLLEEIQGCLMGCVLCPESHQHSSTQPGIAHSYSRCIPPPRRIAIPTISLRPLAMSASA